MKSLIISIVLIVILVFFGWPYNAVYQLDQALVRNDVAKIEQLIDIPKIQENLKAEVQQDIDQGISGAGNFTNMLKQGVSALSNVAVDNMVDVKWVRERLLGLHENKEAVSLSLLNRISYAFYDSHDEFLVRVGELGNKPMHFLMKKTDNQWRVIAIYQ